MRFLLVITFWLTSAQLGKDTAAHGFNSGRSFSAAVVEMVTQDKAKCYLGQCLPSFGKLLITGTQYKKYSKPGDTFCTTP